MKLLTKIIATSLVILHVFAGTALAESVLTKKGYKLDRMVVFSRHNLRSPLSGKGSVQSRVTPHKWYRWTAPKGQLSNHGAAAETIMGQYFRKYLEDERFMPENWQPQEGEVRFYANSFQRTIATARYFSSGMLPVANVWVEHRLGLGKKDPVFLPIYNRSFKKLQEKCLRDNDALFGNQGPKGMIKAITDDFDSLEKILNFKKSAYAKEKGVKHFNRNELIGYLKMDGILPMSFKGSIMDAIWTCDTLLMQYYEEPDNVKAAFGNRRVRPEDWERVGHLLTTANSLAWKNETSALHQSHNLLAELKNELEASDRRFSFLCGHDVNIACILTTLGVEEYKLPGTIATQTPIGGKIVMEKRIGTDGREYVGVSLVYQSDEQIRNNKPLSLAEPPQRYPLRFKALKANRDGLYLLEDFLKLLEDGVERYKALTE